MVVVVVLYCKAHVYHIIVICHMAAQFPAKTDANLTTSSGRLDSAKSEEEEEEVGRSVRRQQP